MKNCNLEVLHIITGLEDGGAEAFLYRLCLFDLKNRHIVVSLMDGGKYGVLLAEKDIRVHCLFMERGRITINGILKLAALLRKYQPDIVQTWMYHSNLLGGIVARLAGLKKLSWGIHHSNLESGFTKKSTIIIARLCALLSGIIPQRIISCSYQAMQIHQSLGYKENKFVVIPNGYDLENFIIDKKAGLKVRIELGLSANCMILGMVARFDPQKDHKTLITALALLKQKGHNFSCLLIGSGICKENKQLVELVDVYNLGSNVVLLGQRTDIPAVMNCLDIHVSSSLGEAFPNVLAEAMACGTPCVTTNVGDAALIVGDNGWVSCSRKPEALCQAIEQAIFAHSEKEFWRNRRYACRKRIKENFSIEHVVHRYNRVWCEMKSEDIVHS